MTDHQPMIRLEQVTKAFGGQIVLDGIDLAIEAGRTTVVIGPSGCGKSVLIKHMIALLRPDRGKVFFREREISSLDKRRLVDVRRRMGFLFQGGALFDSMTVDENLRFPLVEHRVGTPAEQARRCRDVLAMVGLDGLGGRYPAELSGGQKKRVGLARAIVLEPEVIFYDEPTTGLDPIRADLINELILRLHESLHVTSIVVTHDMASARKVGDRILMLHEGRFLADTAPEGLDQIDNDTVARFVRGQAGEEELAAIRAPLGDATSGEPHP